ncbi:MAG TPA: hypothetical protein VF173_19530 [Thermoanaerobaculia bacterium]|nr:hypothetical protein [Thermoanaerobaculia bacterium]
MSTYVIPVTTISQPDMQYDYYQINPPQHAEKAYQPNQGDQFPPVSTVPARSPSGQVVVMVTNIHNQVPFAVGQMELVDYNSLIRFNGGVFPTPAQVQQIVNQHPEIVAAHLSGQTPFLARVSVAPNDPITVRPLTGGYMAKAVSYEDFVACHGRPSI